MEIEDLKKFYPDNGFFKFKKNDVLSIICNAPNDKSGVYLIYSKKNESKNLIYIECSGHIKTDGSISTRSSGKGGIYGRIVNGHQFKAKRFISWPQKMKVDDYDSLEIHWYVTHNDSNIDSPAFVEINLLHNYFKKKKKLPIWNQKL